MGGNNFKPIQIADHPGRIAAGHFKPGKVAQIVMAPGDGNGPLWFIVGARHASPLHCAAGIGLLLPAPGAHATGVQPNVREGSDIVMMDMRWPAWDQGT